MNGYTGDFDKDATTVRALAQKHFGPVQTNPADVDTVLASLDGHTDLGMRNCLAVARSVGVNWTSRQMRETQDEAILRAMRKQSANKSRK